MLTRGREAQARASPDTVLSPLPSCFVRAVLLLLPVDTRLRCSEVSRAWRALLADTTFWARIALRASSGLERFSLPLLRAAVAKAGGQLRALDITGQQQYEREPFVPETLIRLLLEVAAANAATLTEMRVDTGQLWDDTDNARLRWLLEAAPALQLLEASVLITDRQVAHSMLRNEPPFQALRLRQLLLARPATADVVAFSSELRCHASLECLGLNNAALDTAAAMGAVVDAFIALRLHTLVLDGCRVVPAVLSQLTRLIAAGALRKLIINNYGVEMFEEAHESTRLFVAAVRASAMTRLALDNVGAAPESVLEAAALINARPQ